MREHGQDPNQVINVEAAWQAFQAFLACPIEGLEADRDCDADGFIVQWGRYDRPRNRPSLSFTRQMAVDVRATWTESGWYQPEYWQVDLQLVFDDAPALVGIGELEVQDSGFDFSRPGPDRDRAFREVEWEIQQYPTLQALWASTPVGSSLEIYNAD